MSIDEFLDPSRYQGVKATFELPTKEEDEVAQRPDIPPPHPWSKTVVVTHRVSKKDAVVWSVDLMTRQFRLWYPERAAQQMATKDQFDGRSEWQNMDATMWEPKLEFTATELSRQTAVAELERELAMYTSQEELDLVSVLIDTDDPVKALAKLRVLRSANLIRRPDSVQASSTPEPKKAGPK